MAVLFEVLPSYHGVETFYPSTDVMICIKWRHYNDFLQKCISERASVSAKVCETMVLKLV